MTNLHLGVPQHLSETTPLFTSRVTALLIHMYAECKHCDSLFGNERQRDYHIKTECTEVTNDE